MVGDYAHKWLFTLNSGKSKVLVVEHLGLWFDRQMKGKVKLQRKLGKN